MQIRFLDSQHGDSHISGKQTQNVVHGITIENPIYSIKHVILDSVWINDKQRDRSGCL